MDKSNYAVPPGGLSKQTELLTGRSVTTESYAVIPKGVMQDIVTSYLPFWEKTRAWVLARPMSSFAETFSQYIMIVDPDGGSNKPDTDPAAQTVIFVLEGNLTLSVNQQHHQLEPGSYAYISPDDEWELWNQSKKSATFQWIRKTYVTVEGIEKPKSFVTSDKDTKPVPMEHADGRWVTSWFVDPEDMRYDMHVNIVTFQPGAVIPFTETHVMEHGIYILQGKAVYRLNQDWVEVEAGDFIWLRAFCPQACYAGGPENFRYLLYRDANRHMALS